jgi:ABC-type multidrug transport system ATPase subunit
VVRNLRKTVSGGRCVLQDVSFVVRPGELVGIVGCSGAGKTTLLEAMAGVRPADSGSVLFDGAELSSNLDAFRGVLGYVPQDDIVHAELPLGRMLRYVARLRLPSSTRRGELEAAVRRSLAALDLEEREGVRVGALSGGQRKRASIAVELLTEPQMFFLDEPTSGLDPATGAELLRELRSLADGGATVIFTTHSVQDLPHCDSVAVLARDGFLAFHGTLDDAYAYFGVERAAEIYVRLAEDRSPEEWARRFDQERAANSDGLVAAEAQPLVRRRGAGFVRQWSVLSRRTFETMARNRLTLSILLGSPAMVVAMFAVLFRANAFDRAHPSPNAMVMIGFWIAFGAFFFGLTYGLLQVVSERAIIRREHLVVQRLSVYLLSKVTELIPFLLLVVVLMLAVLRGLNRLPAASAKTYLSLGGILLLEAAAALTLGLLASAAVSHPSQATLALPMLCLPAVLFSGAILPVHVMAASGAAISTIIPVRWAFEGIGHALGARAILLHGASPLGPPLVRSYGNAGTATTGTYLAYLGLFTVAFFAGAWAVLARGCRRNTR